MSLMEISKLNPNDFYFTGYRGTEDTNLFLQEETRTISITRLVGRGLMEDSVIVIAYDKGEPSEGGDHIFHTIESAVGQNEEETKEIGPFKFTNLGDASIRIAIMNMVEITANTAGVIVKYGDREEFFSYDGTHLPEHVRQQVIAVLNEFI